MNPLKPSKHDGVPSNRNQPDSLDWTNWEESIALQPARVVLPRTIEAVAQVLRDGQSYPSPVRAAGSRHTTTHCGVTDGGTLMIMRRMDRVLSVDPDGLTVTAQAGALYVDVARELHRHGLQFFVNVEIGNLTMGSAASTGTKDASMPGELGQVCSYCSRVKLVLASGEIREIDEADGELMQAVRSSYGLLGVICEVTFRVRRLQPMAVWHRSYSLDQFERELPALRSSNASIMYYLFPFLDSLTVEFRRYESGAKWPRNRVVWWLRNLFWKTIAPAFSHFAHRCVRREQWRFRVIDAFYRVLQFLLDTLIRSRRSVAGDQIIRYPEHKGVSKYTFSIWAFPEQRIMPTLRAYYDFCRAYYRDHGFRCDILNVGYRIAADQKPLFSYSFDGTVMTLDPVATAEPGWDDFLRAYNAFCSAHGGVPLFNQTKWLTREQVHRAFGERIDTLWRYRIQLDPEDRLLNRYFRELFDPRGCD